MASVSEQIIANTNYSQMTAAASKSASESKSSTSINSQAFLRLLTEQLKYQDPMNPMDNSEMLAQEAQFATLEQMEALTSTFSSFSNIYQANSLLGQCVRVEVDGKGYVGVVEGVDFSDSNGASVFVGDRYFPLSSITNVYYLTETPGEGEEGGEGEAGDGTTEGEGSGETEGGGDVSDGGSDAAETVKSISALNSLTDGNMAKKAYEYAKQAIDDIKGQ